MVSALPTAALEERQQPGRQVLLAAVVLALGAGACTKLLGIDGDYVVGAAGAATGIDSGAEADVQAADEAEIDSTSAEAEASIDAASEPDGSVDACGPNETLCSGTCVALADNAKHCGECGHDCCGGECVQGVCGAFRTFVQGHVHPAVLTADDTHVYWADHDGKMIAKAPKGAHSEPDAGVIVLATEQDGAEDIVVRGNYAYWTNTHPATDGGTAARVMRVSIAGGEPEVLASSEESAHGIAVDDTHVYWTNRIKESGTIKRRALAGGTPELIASGQNAPKRLRLNSSNVFWTNIGSGQIVAAPLAGGDAAVLVDNVQEAHYLALDPQRVYWTTDSPAGVVESALLDGGSRLTIAQAQNRANAVALDDQGAVYWTVSANAGNTTTAGVLKARVDGTSAVTLLANEFGVDPAIGIAVDGSCVYWTAGSFVRAIARKPDVTQLF